jgi:hypothetical protein
MGVRCLLGHTLVRVWEAIRNRHPRRSTTHACKRDNCFPNMCQLNIPPTPPPTWQWIWCMCPLCACSCVRGHRKACAGVPRLASARLQQHATNVRLGEHKIDRRMPPTAVNCGVPEEANLLDLKPRSPPTGQPIIPKALAHDLGNALQHAMRASQYILRTTPSLATTRSSTRLHGTNCSERVSCAAQSTSKIKVARGSAESGVRK